MEERRIDWRKLGNRIAEMRIARGVTQLELAEKTGLSLTYIGYIEQGKRHGTFDTYLHIVNCLGYSMDDLLRDNLKNDLSGSIAWEMSWALDDCGEKERDAILRIIHEVVNMIRLFRGP